MLGIKVREFAPVGHLTLEELVPWNHFYRHVERVLDLGFVRELVAPYYAATGRPSIDPVVFFKLQLVMFFDDIRSERLLMRLVADRLSVRWYLGYNLDEPLPDHSSLTKIRERYGLEPFRRFFEAIVAQCQQAGLVWGKELYLDATKVDANAALDSLVPRFAVEAHLAALFPAGVPDAGGSSALPAEAGTAPILVPVELSPADAAALAGHNAARHDWIARDGRPDRTQTCGSYQRKADFQVSSTDPDATVMQRPHGTHLGYLDHYVVDGGTARIILEVLVTPAEVMENQPALDLLWRAIFRWQLQPRQATGDTTYGTVENIVALEDAHIRAYMPLPDSEKRTPYFGASQFTYDAEHDAYRCPQGQTVRRRTASYTEELVIYQAAAATCNACPLKAACTASDHGRVIKRSFHAEYVERVRAYHQTEPYQKARRKRSVWVEPLFAEAKDWHHLRRFRLRGLTKVNGEALRTAAGQNLKRLLSKRGWGRRPFPGGASGVVLSPLPTSAAMA